MLMGKNKVRDEIQDWSHIFNLHLHFFQNRSKEKVVLTNRQWRSFLVYYTYRHIKNGYINLFWQFVFLLLGVPPWDPRFAGSNPAEVIGFFSDCKNPEHKSSGRNFKPWVPSLRFLDYSPHITDHGGH